MQDNLAQDEAGNIWVVDAQGNPVRLHKPAQQSGGAVVVPTPVDPRVEVGIQDTQADNARADRNLNRQLANDAADRALAERRLRLDEQKAKREAQDAARKAQQQGGGQELTPAARAEALQGFTAAMALSGTRDSLQQRFQEGPGSTSGIGGVMDLLPLASNERFDRAANAARGTVGDVLGFTGGQLNSAEEAKLNVGPYIPQASDKDDTIRDSMERLRDLQNQGLQRSIALMGGVPDASGNIIPLPQGFEINAENVAALQDGTFQGPDDNRPTAWQKNRLVSDDPLHAALMGSTTETVALPDAMQAEYSAGLREMLARNGGRLDPREYAQFRGALDEKYASWFERNGFSNWRDDGKHREWAEQANRALDEGGATLTETIPGLERELSTLGQYRNSAVSNPVGAFLANSADMATMGAGTAKFGDRMAALQHDNPISSTLGQIGGAVAGTGMVGAGGRAGFKALAPDAYRKASAFLASGKKGSGAARFGRNLAEDVAYSAGYGQVTEGDAGTGALLGGVGSALGQGAGRVLGKAIGGGKPLAAAQRLNDRGIPTTVGQNLGGALKTVEDAMSSIPAVGSMANARRAEGLEAFNREMFREVGGEVPPELGEEGVKYLKQNTVPNAYGRALDGRQFYSDPESLAALNARGQAASQLPPDIAPQTVDALKRSFGDYIPDWENIDGRQIQQARMGLNRRASKFDRMESPSGTDGADVLRGARSDLDAMVGRQDPEAMPLLNEADRVYARSKVVQDAMKKAVNQIEGGVMPDDMGTVMVMPQQLRRSANQQADKFGGRAATGDQYFSQLSRDAQQVLPSSMPDSGTPYRQLAQGGLGMGAAGGGIGYAVGGGEGAQTGAQTGAGLAAALTALGTRRGQQIVNSTLFARPDQLRRAAEILAENNRIAGRAALPFAITQ